KIWFIEDHIIKVYPGTYAEYEVWQANRKLELKANTAVAPAPKKEVKKEPVAQKPADDRNQQLKKLNQSLFKLEEQIATLEKAVKELESHLADEEIYSKPDK